jgi:hypothetical protein
VKRHRLLAWLCIAVVVGVMLAPAAALARSAGGGRGGGGRGHGGHHHGGHHRGGHHRGGHSHNGFHKGFHHGGFGHGQKSFHVNFFDNGFHHKGHHFKGHHQGFFSSCCAGVVYAPPAVYYPPAVSYSADYAPVYATTYQVPPVYSPAPMAGTGSVTLAPAPPSVVEYPHGRYELRGDGVTTAYQWVWIPDPPPAPPPAAPPAPAVTPPAAPQSAPAPPPASDAPRPQIYRWTDDLGVTHLTNRADRVPPEHRKAAAPAPQP